MKLTQKMHFVAYLAMTILTIVLAIAAVSASITGSIDIFTGGLAAVVFIVFAILQIACLSIYQPALTPYKVGFYLMHIGLLVLLAGLAAYELAGESLTVQVPVSESGYSYSSVQNEDGELVDLGFAFKIKDFQVEKYESGNDKYYRADVIFTDPATLQQSEDYLEVNRTRRNNGWKLYLMDYSDGAKLLSSTYGLTADSFYETYNADGERAGQTLLELIYQDVAGVRYSYYLYDETNTRFIALTEEEVSLLTGSLWAYTVEEDGYIAVYLTRRDGSFTETLTATGSEVLAQVESTYSDERISYYYYTIDRGIVTWLYDESVDEATPNPISTYGEVFAGIRKTDAGVQVYVMARELTPAHSFHTTEGGSPLLAEITSVCGEESNEISYMLYSASAGGYQKADETDIAELSGKLYGYALNMGGEALIYVHPLSLILLIKQDPGEWATIAGMGMVILGALLMCLVRGKKKTSSDAQTDVSSAESKKTAKEALHTVSRTTSSAVQKSKGGRK